MAATRYLLDPRPMGKLEQGGNFLQGSIFTAIYAFLPIVLGANTLGIVLRSTLFPLGTLISIYRTLFVHWPEFLQQENKSAGKMLGITVNTASTLAETIAVFGFAIPSLIAGYSLVPTAVVPGMFLGLIGLNFLWHGSKTCVHLYRMAKAYKKNGTHSVEYAHHKREAFNNFIPSLMFAACGVVIGFLMLTPVLWPVSAVALTLAAVPWVVPAIQYGGAAIVGMITSLPVTVPLISKLINRVRFGKSSTKKSEVTVYAGIPDPDNAIVRAPASEYDPRGYAGWVKGAPDPIGFSKTGKGAFNDYRDPAKFTTLSGNHLADLARKLEASKSSPFSDEPQHIILDFLAQEEERLKKAAGFSEATLDADGNFRVKRQADGGAVSVDFRRTSKEINKVYALRLLTELVKGNPLQLVQSKNQTPLKEEVTCVDDIKRHLKATGVKHTATSYKHSIGNYTKVEDLVRRYFADPELRAEKRAEKPGSRPMSVHDTPRAIRRRQTARAA